MSAPVKQYGFRHEMKGFFGLDQQRSIRDQVVYAPINRVVERLTGTEQYGQLEDDFQIILKGKTASGVVAKVQELEQMLFNSTQPVADDTMATFDRLYMEITQELPPLAKLTRLTSKFDIPTQLRDLHSTELRMDQQIASLKSEDLQPIKEHEKEGFQAFFQLMQRVMRSVGDNSDIWLERITEDLTGERTENAKKLITLMIEIPNLAFNPGYRVPFQPITHRSQFEIE